MVTKKTQQRIRLSRRTTKRKRNPDQDDDGAVTTTATVETTKPIIEGLSTSTDSISTKTKDRDEMISVSCDQQEENILTSATPSATTTNMTMETTPSSSSPDNKVKTRLHVRCIDHLPQEDKPKFCNCRPNEFGATTSTTKAARRKAPEARGTSTTFHGTSTKKNQQLFASKKDGQEELLNSIYAPSTTSSHNTGDAPATNPSFVDRYVGLNDVVDRNTKLLPKATSWKDRDRLMNDGPGYADGDDSIIAGGDINFSEAEKQGRILKTMKIVQDIKEDDDDPADTARLYSMADRCRKKDDLSDSEYRTLLQNALKTISRLTVLQLDCSTPINVHRLKETLSDILCKGSNGDFCGTNCTINELEVVFDALCEQAQIAETEIQGTRKKAIKKLEKKLITGRGAAESKKKDLLKEDTQILETADEILKDEVKWMQKQLLKDLLAFKEQQGTKMCQTHSLQGETREMTSKSRTVEKKPPAPPETEKMLSVLEREMTRLAGEAKNLQDDLDKQQKASIEDLDKNYDKLKSALRSKRNHKPVGSRLKVRHHCSEKRAIIDDWMWQNVMACELCLRWLPTSLEGSHVEYCKECDCCVCFSCDCEIFHLSKQEELLIASEDAEKAKLEATILAKKKKNQRRKERKKKNAKKKKESPIDSSQPTDPRLTKTSKKDKEKTLLSTRAGLLPTVKGIPRTCDDELRDDKCEGKREHQTTTETRLGAQRADFVAYLQDTRSLIALSALMDELEEGKGVDLDDGHNGLASFQDPIKTKLMQDIKKVVSDKLASG